MNRIARKLLIAAFMGLMVASGLYEFYDSGGPDYYSSHPARLLYVLAITLAITAVGVPAAFLYCRLSPRAQRGAKLLVLGSVAAFLSLVLGCVLLWLIPATVWGAEFTGLTLFFGLLVGVAGLAAVAALLWYDFFRLLKTGRSRLL